MIDARPPRWMESLAGAWLQVEKSDYRLGDLSERYVRTLAGASTRFGTTPWAMYVSRSVCAVAYIASAVNVAMFARVVDPCLRLAESGEWALVALNLWQRIAAVLQFVVGRLVLPVFLLACGGASIVGGIGVWHSWHQVEASMVSAHRNKALAIAQHVTSFLEDLKDQIGWVAHPETAMKTADRQQDDYIRLLRQVPAITQLSRLDRWGREQLQVNRYGPNRINSGIDRSAEAAFIAARTHRPYIELAHAGKAQTPHLTVALPIVSWPFGVTVAEIDLGLVRGVLSALKADDGGYAYILDGDGYLVAHNQETLTLSKVDYDIVPQIAAALAGTPSTELIDGQSVDIAGAPRSVRSIFADIPDLDWKVLVDVPAAEYEMPYRQAEFDSCLLAGCSAVFVALAIVFGFRPVRPGRRAT